MYYRGQGQIGCPMRSLNLCWELEPENWRLCSTTLVRGVAGELEDENWRLGSTTLVRGVAGEWEDENWRLGSTT